jgi:hypothetical protein
MLLWTVVPPSSDVGLCHADWRSGCTSCGSQISTCRRVFRRSDTTRSTCVIGPSPAGSNALATNKALPPHRERAMFADPPLASRLRRSRCGARRRGHSRPTSWDRTLGNQARSGPPSGSLRRHCLAAPCVASIGAGDRPMMAALRNAQHITHGIRASALEGGLRSAPGRDRPTSTQPGLRDLRWHARERAFSGHTRGATTIQSADLSRAPTRRREGARSPSPSTFHGSRC